MSKEEDVNINFYMKEEFEMMEKVNPSYPDKVADIIAEAIDDLGYKLLRSLWKACRMGFILKIYDIFHKLF